jgi:hypothetical protein
MTMDKPSLVSTSETVFILISQIKNKKAGMYFRFGDGDFNIVSGMDDMLAKTTPNFQHWMKEAMKIDDTTVMTCIPHHCKDTNTLEEGMYPGNHEYPIDMVRRFIYILSSLRNNIPNVLYTNIALSYCASRSPDIVIELHKELKKNNILYIGNNMYSKEFLTKLFGDSIDTIYTPQRDSYFEHDSVFSRLDTLYHTKYNLMDFFVIIMAAGCGGRAFSAEIYSKYYNLKRNFFLFDYGSLLDYLWGYKSRAYMDIDPPKSHYILNSI